MGDKQKREVTSASSICPTGIRTKLATMEEQKTKKMGRAKNAQGAAGAAVLTGGSVAPAVALSVPVRRIATFHLNGLGDLLFTLPALHALRESFPGAKICAVVRPGLASLLRDSPYVDEILLRPKGGLSKQTSLMLQLRARHIDLCVAFSQSRNTTMLAWSSGAAMRVGFESARMENLLTHRVPKVGPPTIETHLDLVRSLGCQTHQHDYRGLLHVSPASTVAADALLEANGIKGPFVIAACEASLKRGIKEWPVAHWARGLDELAVRIPVVLVGTQPTVAVTELMKAPVVDLGGRTDLPTLAALCGRARLFLGIDSGVMHLAASM
ncbi:MAG TPA: glycosyltransferase family 9 protein, partial [Abditibacteriaceae bacterium]